MQYTLIFSHLESFDLQSWVIFLLIVWSVAAGGCALYQVGLEMCGHVWFGMVRVAMTTYSCSSAAVDRDQPVCNIIFLVAQLVIVPGLMHTGCVSKTMNLRVVMWTSKHHALTLQGRKTWHPSSVKQAWNKILFLWDQLGSVCNLLLWNTAFKFVAIFHLSCRVETERIPQMQLHLTENLLQVLGVLVRNKSKAQETKAMTMWDFSNKTVTSYIVR